MNIDIQTIPHSEQRYPTTGDWWWDGDTLHLRVSDMGNWKYEMAVAYHEMREALMCKHLGIQQSDVDEFDMEFEKNLLEGDMSEPGNDPKAPYFLPHQYATRDERLLIADLGENWDEYDKTVLRL